LTRTTNSRASDVASGNPASEYSFGANPFIQMRWKLCRATGSSEIPFAKWHSRSLRATGGTHMSQPKVVCNHCRSLCALGSSGRETRPWTGSEETLCIYLDDNANSLSQQRNDIYQQVAGLGTITPFVDTKAVRPA